MFRQRAGQVEGLPIGGDAREESNPFVVRLGPALQFLERSSWRRAPAFGKFDLPWPVESQRRGRPAAAKVSRASGVESIRPCDHLCGTRRTPTQTAKLHGYLGMTAGDGFSNRGKNCGGPNRATRIRAPARWLPPPPGNGRSGPAVPRSCCGRNRIRHPSSCGGRSPADRGPVRRAQRFRNPGRRQFPGGPGAVTGDDEPAAVHRPDLQPRGPPGWSAVPKVIPANCPTLVVLRFGIFADPGAGRPLVADHGGPVGDQCADFREHFRRECGPVRAAPARRSSSRPVGRPAVLHAHALENHLR